MTFQSLSYFLVVYEERSITEAAKRLFISQQSLSVHIQRLEETCGTKLFIRRPVFRPTYAGDRLAVAAREILRVKKEILAEIKEIDAGQKGKMSLGFTGFLAGDHLPELLRQFNQQYPGIEVTAVTSPSLQLEEQTLDGRLDFYIGSTARKNGEMVEIPLIETGLVVAVREQVLKENTDFTDEKIRDAEIHGIGLEEIRQIPLIVPYRGGGRVREILDRHIKANKIDTMIRLETHHTIIVSACQKGIGAGLIYSVTPVDDRNLDDRICRFPIKNLDYTIHTCICYRQDHFLTSHEEAFIRLTKAYFEKMMHHVRT
ncbi:MAG: LysR family transcriptional regulator [Lachnospiraceae bacterium]|nr:LysR family transcriptional regulator [Lachnospiraceae bacterium]